MSNPKSFIHLKSLAWDTGILSPEEFKAACKTWLCPACRLPKPTDHPVDVKISNRILRQGPLSYVECLPLAKLSFLLRFGEERLRRDLHIGKVYGPDGKMLDDWVTFLGKRRLIVRGTNEVNYRICPECERQIYFAMPPSYIFPEPPNEVELFESDLSGLIFPENLGVAVGIQTEGQIVQQVVVLNWPGVSDLTKRNRFLLVEKLNVSREAKDGFPCELN